MASIISAGTTSGTSLNLSGDTSGVLQLATNGSTTAVTVDTSQNVGIGTASPAATLTVAHTSGVDGRGIRLVNSSNSQTWENRIGVQALENTSYAIKDITAGSVRFLINTAGDVGIGTNSPTGKLSVAGIVKSTALSTIGNDGVWMDFSAPNGRIAAINSSGAPASNLLLATTTTGGSTQTVLQCSFDGTAKVLTTLGVGNTAGSTSGAGITFPATQSASSNANTLDDYEEGTWTPTINSGFTSPTYSVQIGTYTKVGNVVTFSLQIDVSGGTRNGNIVNFTLPFAGKNISNNPGSASWAYVSSGVVSSTTTNLPTLYVNTNAASMGCYKSDGSTFLGTDLNNATPSFYLGGSYLTD